MIFPHLKRKARHFLIFSTIILVYFHTPQLAVAQTDEKTIAEEVLAQSIHMAQEGHAEDQYYLGLTYFLGRGVLKDETKAMEWFKKAAEQDHVIAQYCLGKMYSFGLGVRKDESKAIDWLKKAADQDHAISQYELGTMYNAGVGVSRDVTIAFEWYEKSASQGHATAQFNLGIFYANGVGVPKDETKAFKWYKKAAEQGDASAQNMLGGMYFYGRGVPKDEINAVEWYKKAAVQGDASAQVTLGWLYIMGRGVSKDETKAFKWYKKAAEQGDASAQNRLGGMYLNGRGVTKDEIEGAEWYKKAAEQGDASAQKVLGLMYATGMGVPLNNVQAYAWSNLAAANGESIAAEVRDRTSRLMTREEIAQAQRISAAFEPVLAQADPQEPNQVFIEPTQYVFGSGFFISTSGYFVTNNHVVDEAKKIRIKTNSGTYEATVVRTDPNNDLALLKVSGTFSPLYIRGSRGVRVADSVATIGFPNPSLQGLESKYGTGVVSAVTGPSDDPRFFQISVPIQPGNSGGPLVDTSGSVVGVVAAKLDQLFTLEISGSIPENVGYAIKGTILLSFMESVPDLLDSLATNPGTKPLDPADLADKVDDTVGMVIVEQ